MIAKFINHKQGSSSLVKPPSSPTTGPSVPPGKIPLLWDPLGFIARLSPKTLARQRLAEEASPRDAKIIFEYIHILNLIYVIYIYNIYINISLYYAHIMARGGYERMNNMHPGAGG